METTLFKNLGALAMLMIANTVFRVAYAIKAGDFDKAVLKQGILKYFIIFCGVGLFYWAGNLCPTTGIVVSGEVYTIPAAINLIALGLISIYAAKCFKNLAKIFECEGLIISKKENINECDKTKIVKK